MEAGAFVALVPESSFPPPLCHFRPFRHSRESGNPGAAEGRYNGVPRLHPAWIPAFAGTTDTKVEGTRHGNTHGA